MRGVTPGKGGETAQRLLAQPSQEPRAEVPEHSLHDRAARQAASPAPSLNQSSWHEGDDTEQGYKMTTTFILSHLYPEVVNKHVTTDEATGNRASCFHWCITL